MPNQLIATIDGGQTRGRAFDRILIIMFENQYRGYVLGGATPNSCVGIAAWSFTRQRLVFYMTRSHY